jgi:hypothetical protein
MSARLAGVASGIKVYGSVLESPAAGSYIGQLIEPSTVPS